ncbi:MAG: sugar phosphate isomerase/epimerase family protein [Chloroflexota bacterium]|nr:sugar phosphate isomerase/epimerase family protein [Chloroflexota bacterium]
MRLGISSYTYTWAIGVPGHPRPPEPLGAMGLLDKAAALSVDLVQIADNLPLHRLSPIELGRLVERAKILDIDIEVGTRGVAPDHLRTYLELAERLNSPILRIVTDTADHRPSEKEIVSTIGGLVPDFARADVVLAIENHDRFKARQLADILRRIDSDQVGVCLDTVNSFGALEGPEVVVETLGPWAVNLHVKDFDIFRASHLMGFTIEGRPAGQGRLDVPWLLDELEAMGRNPNAILELWTPPEETSVETVSKEAAWARESIAYLHQFIPD